MVSRAARTSRTSVGLVVLALVVLASTARAEMIVVEAPRPPSLLGTRIMAGLLRLDEWNTTMSLAVDYDRAFAGKWRALLEYEYMWLGKTDWNEHMETEAGIASLTDHGHRLSFGVRREVSANHWNYDRTNLLFDAEAGVGAMLVEGMDTKTVPHAFAGVRMAFELKNLPDNDGHSWQYEVLARGFAVPHGGGVLFGIGLVWGD